MVVARWFFRWFRGFVLITAHASLVALFLNLVCLVARRCCRVPTFVVPKRQRSAAKCVRVTKKKMKTHTGCSTWDVLLCVEVSKYPSSTFDNAPGFYYPGRRGVLTVLLYKRCVLSHLRDVVDCQGEQDNLCWITWSPCIPQIARRQSLEVMNIVYGRV